MGQGDAKHTMSLESLTVFLDKPRFLKAATPEVPLPLPESSLDQPTDSLTSIRYG